MSVRVRDVMLGALGELRYEPTEKRVRAWLGSETAVDSVRALLVWEPRRVVPAFAVPLEDLHAELLPTSPLGPDAPRALLHPGIPFAHHSCGGDTLSVRGGSTTRERAAFLPADAALHGYVLLDFDAFDAWYEEDERLCGHPRDPYHRVDFRQSSRRVRIELEGTLLAESTRCVIAFETNLPVRFYLPRQDVRIPLQPSAWRTCCAYKGEASYDSFEAGGQLWQNHVWSYEAPLVDARAITGLVAFYDEKVDVHVDGVPRPRPHTVFSEALLEEFGV